MRNDRGPATVVVCCGVPHGISAADFVAHAELAEKAGIAITWAARPADMVAIVEVLGLKASRPDIALALDPGDLQSRPTLRREIAAARAITGRTECVVVSGTPSLEHRALLVECGIHTIAVGGFEAAPRSSRRPAPTGWPCRSVVWGLWEAQSVAEPPRSVIGRILPWIVGPRLAPGSLTVVHVDLGGLARLAAWMTRQSGRVQATCLSDLPELLRAAGQRDTGSVLRQAA